MVPGQCAGHELANVLGLLLQLIVYGPTIAFPNASLVFGAHFLAGHAAAAAAIADVASAGATAASDAFGAVHRRPACLMRSSRQRQCEANSSP